mmetsp:Transcript_54949/g.112204  ORF Transcript_54949/g.112204 Transcript_54949/m.112204 type:complete len:222 (-) Transcript_54949:1745-2410(-)
MLTWTTKRVSEEGCSSTDSIFPTRMSTGKIVLTTATAFSTLVYSTSPTLMGVPGLRLSKAGERAVMGMAGVESLSKILATPSGMKGARKCARMYIASHTLRHTTWRFLAASASETPLASSALMCHGAISVRNLLVSLTAWRAHIAASCSRLSSKAVALSLMRRSTSKLANASTSGTLPSQYFCVMLVARCIRLPRESASSELCMSARPSSLKGMSWPKGEA